ncbi:hypothetical protein ED733_008499 [Metarhizium rileyi]|uniref:F-box domain-containing protein n=1 Tax=Metarhizium rileyi (strain RCEF 4871) TaxID=1649241 RepID=A0A5C6GIJ2_METRR|nr:hypothetical protein ED733_008499 [Metarhizium rileyi]
MGQTSYMHPSLTMPEILVNMFDFLEAHPSTLAAASRVNKQWFSCATDVLWREAPCRVLANVPEHRRQVYASKLTSLAFSGDDEAVYHSCFMNLQFSRLRSVSLDTYRPADGNQFHIRQYLQPPLQEFSFYGGDLDVSLLDYLCKTCWRLRKILIDSPGPTIRASSFLSFISGYQSVEHMEFRNGMDHLLTDEFLVHVASRTNLSSLAVGKICSEQLVRQISTDVPKPFEALRALHMAIPSSAVQLLVPLIKHVTRLHLDVRDSTVHVVRQLSSIPNLRVLSLAFAATTRLPRAEIMSLTTHSKLEELEIGPDETEDVSHITAMDDGFSDADFDELCSQLRALRSISFKVQCNLSVTVLASLSEHCPLLEKCTMPQILNLQALNLERRHDVMFQKLHLLDLGGFQQPDVNNDQVSRRELPPHDLASLMRRHFPYLEELYASSDDTYSNAVVDAFAALQSGKGG